MVLHAPFEALITPCRTPSMATNMSKDVDELPYVGQNRAGPLQGVRQLTLIKSFVYQCNGDDVPATHAILRLEGIDFSHLPRIQAAA